MEQNTQHVVWRMVPIIGALVTFAATATINALSAQGPNALFVANQTSLSAKYDTPITPAGWTFSIWGFIYAWQALHLVYGLTLLCRRAQGQYLYLDPTPVPTTFYLVYMLNNACNMGWIFTFDREVLSAALVFLLLIAITLYICLAIAMRHLVVVGAALVKNGQYKDVWFARMFVHNGIALYCAWTSIASLLNLSIVLMYQANASRETVAWLSLAIVNLLVVIIFILETFVFDKYMRYTFSHYITLVVALSGILSQNYASDLAYMNYAIFLLVLSGVLGVVKILIMIIRGVKDPINYQMNKISSTLEVDAESHRF